jgi:cytochrome o ubiquinol oxidase subunit 2
LTVLLLSGVIWIGSHQLDPRVSIAAKAGPLRVDVVALDWKWLFVYPDREIAAVNQLTIPVDTPVEFRLTSATVMNSFFVPQLGSQIYTMGGMTTRLNLLASEPGEFQGFSANFSGRDFSRMRFTVKAVPAAMFDAWLGQVRSAGAVLDDAGLAELMKPGLSAPGTYRSVAPQLFERILQQTAAGPARTDVDAAWCPPPPGEKR